MNRKPPTNVSVSHEQVYATENQLASAHAEDLLFHSVEYDNPSVTTPVLGEFLESSGIQTRGDINTERSKLFSQPLSDITRPVSQRAEEERLKLLTERNF